MTKDIDTTSPNDRKAAPRSLNAELARLVRGLAKVYFKKFRDEQPPKPNWFVRFFSALLGTAQYFLVLIVTSEQRLATLGRTATSSEETLADAATQVVSLGAYISGFLVPTLVIFLVATPIGMAMIVATGARRAGPIRSFVLGAATPALVHFIGSKVV